MPDFITLSCPSCGHKLQITEDINRFACAACGNEHIVNRSGGIVSLKPVIDEIKKIVSGVDKTGSEMAIVRIKEEIGGIESEIYSTTHSINESRGSGGTGRKMSARFFLIVAIVLLILYGVYYGNLSRLPEGMFLGKLAFLALGAIISFFVSIALFVSSRRKIKEHNRELDRKLDAVIPPLENKLREKRGELAAHQEIVSKNK